MRRRRQTLKLGYWRVLCVARSDRLLSVVFRNRCTEVAAGTAPMSCLRSFETSLLLHGFAQCWRDCVVGPSWERGIRRASIRLAREAERSVFSTSSTLVQHLPTSQILCPPPTTATRTQGAGVLRFPRGEHKCEVAGPTPLLHAT